MHVANAQNVVVQVAAHCHLLSLPVNDGNNDSNAPAYFATDLQVYSGPTAAQNNAAGQM